MVWDFWHLVLYSSWGILATVARPPSDSTTCRCLVTTLQGQAGHHDCPHFNILTKYTCIPIKIMVPNLLHFFSHKFDDIQINNCSATVFLCVGFVIKIWGQCVFWTSQYLSKQQNLSQVQWEGCPLSTGSNHNDWQKQLNQVASLYKIFL